MNQQTKAFLKDLAALCDAHGIYFAGNIGADDAGRPRAGVSFMRQIDIATGDYVDVWVANLDDIQAQLAQD